MPLPLLREELALLPGPTLADGQPSHTLHDPSRNLFFQIGWPAFEILSRWHLGDPIAIVSAIEQGTTLHLHTADIDELLRFLAENQLLQPQPSSAGAFAAKLKKAKGNFAHWLLHNYLFFRIPLLKPDGWLDRWVGKVEIFYSRRFLNLTLGALAFGLLMVYREWEHFASTLVDTLTWSGMASYGVTLIVVKFLHELGHAFTAKRYGCRVPAMGMAFLVLWPVAYTDTNEVWKLTDRQQRLGVAAAGILTELAIAVWATLAWSLLPEGTPKAIAFLLATTTWISTLLINASPFMRFDGYFLLSDGLGMPNLHARSFALARWDMRERLFALGEPAPEVFPRTRHIGLILFAYATWIYRLVVFLGIAALVYSFFIKALGILLFIVEIGWFVLLPFYREWQAWLVRWTSLRQSRRARRTAAIALAMFVLLILPWPSRIATSGLLRPLEQWVIYAPAHAQLAALPIADGTHVKAGTQLLQLTSPDMETRQRSALARLERLRWSASAGAFDHEQRAQWQVSQVQLTSGEAELLSVQADAARYAPTAPFDGVFRSLDPDIKPGDWFSQQQPLARLIGDRGQMVITYLDEEAIGEVALGDQASFYADGIGGPIVNLKVTSIDKDSSRTLPEIELSTLYGGSILVRERKGIFFPERPAYRVTLMPKEDSAEYAQQVWRGKVVISGNWVAPGWRYLRGVITLFWREAGF